MTQMQADVRRCGAAAVAVRRRRLLRRSALAIVSCGGLAVCVCGWGKTQERNEGGRGTSHISPLSAGYRGISRYVRPDFTKPRARL